MKLDIIKCDDCAVHPGTSLGLDPATMLIQKTDLQHPTGCRPNGMKTKKRPPLKVSRFFFAYGGCGDEIQAMYRSAPGPGEADSRFQSRRRQSRPTADQLRRRQAGIVVRRPVPRRPVTGGHIIKLGPGNDEAALSALTAAKAAAGRSIHSFDLSVRPPATARYETSRTRKTSRAPDDVFAFLLNACGALKVSE